MSKYTGRSTIMGIPYIPLMSILFRPNMLHFDSRFQTKSRQLNYSFHIVRINVTIQL